MKLEARGVRCLECRGADLQAYPEQSKAGFGWCTLAAVPHFVSVRMARNCKDFEAAPAEVVEPREKWGDKLPIFEQRPKS